MLNKSEGIMETDVTRTVEETQGDDDKSGDRDMVWWLQKKRKLGRQQKSVVAEMWDNSNRKNGGGVDKSMGKLFRGAAAGIVQIV